MVSVIVKFVLLLLALLGSHEFIAARLNSLESTTAFGVYTALCVVLLLLLGAVMFCRTTIVRCALALVLSISFLGYEAPQRIFGEALTYGSFVSLISARGFILDSVQQFGSQILVALIQSVFLFLSIALPAPKAWKRFSGVHACLATVVAVGMLAAMLFLRGGFGSNGLPSMYTALSYSVLYGYESLAVYRGPRNPVTLPHTDHSKAQDIVFIVDESVRGDFLDINSSSGVRSGLDRSLEGATLYNFGIAAAPAHCSDATNLIFRYAGGRDTFIDDIRRQPSIWAYAQAAGFETIYVDAQRTGGALHNRMDAEELAKIDQHVQFDGAPVMLRDQHAANALASFLADDVRQFLYVNKVGAHFPVHDKYPDHMMNYEPVLPRGRFSDISDTGEREALFSGDWDRYRNSYRNTLLWNTGEFFHTLFEQLGPEDLQRSFIVYTSDHGQNFHESGEPGYNTHCSVTPPGSEGVVPLVLIVGSELDDSTYTQSRDFHFNGASAFGIVPQLLEVMGYSQQDVWQRFPLGLGRLEQHPFSFNFTFNARLGAPQRFRRITLDAFDVHDNP